METRLWKWADVLFTDQSNENTPNQRDRFLPAVPRGSFRTAKGQFLLKHTTGLKRPRTVRIERRAFLPIIPVEKQEQTKAAVDAGR